MEGEFVEMGKLIGAGLACTGMGGAGSGGKKERKSRKPLSIEEMQAKMMEDIEFATKKVHDRLYIDSTKRVIKRKEVMEDGQKE